MARALARTIAAPPEWQQSREVKPLTKEILALQRDAGAKKVRSGDRRCMPLTNDRTSPHDR